MIPTKSSLVKERGAGRGHGLQGSFDLENPVFRTPVRVITKQRNMKEQLFVPGYGFNEILLTHTHTHTLTKRKGSTINNRF